MMDEETKSLLLKKLQLDYLSLYSILQDLEKVIAALVVDIHPIKVEIPKFQEQMKELLK